MPAMSKDIVILGGGLSGLQLARLLKVRGRSAIVLEGREVVGGLCRSIRRGAWSWDIGPHAFYSRRPEAMRYYRDLPVDYIEHSRNVRVCHHDGGGIREVGYPFENGLADLGLRQRWGCLWGYWKAYYSGERPFRHLEHWIREGLGSGIARHFMLPYNRKIWDSPLDRISMTLVRQKIDPEPPWKILRNALVSGTVGRRYQSRFLYPRKGAGALPEAVRASVEDRVCTGWRAVRLEARGGGWRVSSDDGRSVEAGAVVSTIPIPELLGALKDPGLDDLAGRFRHNDTAFATVGLKEGRRFARFDGCHWVFFAGPQVFYRVTITSALTGAFPPTASAEITQKSGAKDPPSLAEPVLRDLLGAGIVAREEDVEFIDCRLERFTYPIQTVGLEKDREELERRLRPRGIHLLGRSGRWDYLNTDGVFEGAEAFVRKRFGELTGA
jgi:protoporphyrinogen oxidase